MKHASFAALVNFGVRLLAGRGVPPGDARHVSESAVLNEAAGVITHGVAQFFYFDRQVGSGIEPGAQPRLVREKAAVALIDGNRSFAQLAFREAARLAAEKARDFGLAMVCVRNTSWVAGLGVKLIPLVRQGCFVQLWAGSSYKFVAPFGGRESMLGTNPVAFGFPVPGRPPVISDFSTSIIARGGAGRMARAGQKAPEKIFLDARGRASDDPGVLEKGGTIMLLGGEYRGHKGFGLSLWVEALGMMAGNPYGPDRALGEHFALVAVDPAIFGEKSFYDREIRRFTESLAGSAKRPGRAAIRLPGQRSFQALAESRQKGIPLDDEMVEALDRLARRNGFRALRTRR